MWKIMSLILDMFSVLAWTMPGMGEPSGLPSMGSHIVGHDWSQTGPEMRNLGLCVICV